VASEACPDNDTLLTTSSFASGSRTRSLESKDAAVTVETLMVDTILGALKWGVVGFVVTLFLMVLFEASRIHDDIPVPEFKRRHTRRTTIVLSIFAGILSGLVWLLVQRLD
jgi:hypothetical protein